MSTLISDVVRPRSGNSVSFSDITITGNLSVGGTITKEDVTNVDSIGLITARSGVKVTAGGVNVTAGGINVEDSSINVVRGKVGIGTTNPQESLHIHSTAVGGAAIELSENTGSAYQGLIQMRGNDMEIRGSSGQMEFYTGNADGASSTEKMRMTDGGQLLLNTTSNASNAEPVLVVSGRANAVTDSAIMHVKRGTAAASLNPGDALGEITFTALDGGPAAQLIAKTGPGYSGTSDCPGELQIRTTVDGGNAPTERMKITSNGGIILSNGILVERFHNVSTGAWSSVNSINLDNGNVFLNTNNLAGSSNTINFTSTNGLNTDLETGDMTSVTLITACSNTGSYINAIQIDSSVTPTVNWVGGTAPSDGGGSGYDTYIFNVMKTGGSTYVVIGNQVKGS